MCRKKGYAAITDANLVLGRILPEFFPAIFGESEDQPLDADASFKALEKIAAEVNSQSKKKGQPEKSVDEVILLVSTCTGSSCHLASEYPRHACRKEEYRYVSTQMSTE